MRFLKAIVFLFAIILLMTSCQTNEQRKHTEAIIYTSIYPLEFIVEQLTSDFAITETIFPPGVDAHTYEPTIKDILSIAEGEAFLFLGENMEGSANKISNALKNSNVKLIELGKQNDIFLENDHPTDDEHAHGDFDPHIWFDPERMIFLSTIVKDELSKIFPNDKKAIEENFARLSTQLAKLDEQYHVRLQQQTKRHIIVSHAAYGYWEHKYGIKQIPISGLSSTDEPSQKALAHLIELAEEMDLKYVLFEKSTSHRLATIVQEEIEAEALYIHNLETLLPEDIEQGKDYLSIMYENLDVLEQATK